MFEEYELSLIFNSPEVAAIDVRSFGKLQRFIRRMEVTIHIVDESQVINSLPALRDAGIRPQEHYLSSRHNHAGEIDPSYLVGAIPGPEYSADIANSVLARCPGAITLQSDAANDTVWQVRGVGASEAGNREMPGNHTMHPSPNFFIVV